MRLRFTLFLIVCGLGMTASSQIQYGLKAGWNYTSAYVKTRDGIEMSSSAGNGFFAGVQAKIPFEKKLYFQTQLLLSKKAFSVHSQNILKDSAATTDLSIYYVEIPLFLHFQTSDDPGHFFLDFGPSFSIAARGDERITYMNESVVERPMKFAFNAYGRMEANLGISAGYNFRNNLMIYASYLYGLGSIIDDDFGPKVKPRTIQVGAGYLFQRKKEQKFRIRPL